MPPSSAMSSSISGSWAWRLFRVGFLRNRVCRWTTAPKTGCLGVRGTGFGSYQLLAKFGCPLPEKEKRVFRLVSPSNSPKGVSTHFMGRLRLGYIFCKIPRCAPARRGTQLAVFPSKYTWYALSGQTCQRSHPPTSRQRTLGIPTFTRTSLQGFFFSRKTTQSGPTSENNKYFSGCISRVYLQGVCGWNPSVYAS